MPIEVKHGLPGEALAVAGAGVGAGQGVQRELDRAQRDAHLAARLQQQRELTLAQIGARADLQRQAADEAMARTALRAGLDEHLREQHFEQQIELQKQAAVAKADQWEYEFTTEQRQQIARLNNARQQIMQSDAFTPAEKQEAIKLLELQQAGIEPAAMPAKPNKLPPITERLHKTEDGALMITEPDGSARLLQRFDQSPEFHQMKLEMEREKAILDMRKELMTEQVEVRKMVDGEEQIDYRQRTPEEVDAMLRIITGSHAGPAEGGESSSDEPWGNPLGGPAGRQQQQQQEQSWDVMAKRNGLKVRAADKKLPPQVGYASAFVRTLAERYPTPEQIPEDQQAAYREAVQIIKSHYGLGQPQPTGPDVMMAGP